jgi:ribosomal protein S18 acetylase RimI-like enzyme
VPRPDSPQFGKPAPPLAPSLDAPSATVSSGGASVASEETHARAVAGLSCGPRTPEQVRDSALPISLRWDAGPISLHIRPLEESDVRALEWHGGPDLRSFYEWQWERHCEGEREVLVVVFNGFPIGQVALHWDGKPAHPGVPDIQSLRVMDLFRGLGIGSKLIEACELEASRRTCGKIGLAVALDNAPARRLYERLGYRAHEPSYFDHWDYINARGETVHVEEHVIDLIKDLSQR